MMRVIKKIWWLPLVLYLIIMPSFMSARVYDQPCRDISISIIDSMEYRFVTPGRLLTIIQDAEPDLLGTRLEHIDTERIEQLLSGLPELESLEVFLTADGAIHIEADQRDPLIRIITAWGNNYYIDNYGFVIPHTYAYTPRMLVVSGNIEVPDECIMGESILEQDHNMMIRQVFSIAEYINRNEFWNRQLEQIYIDKGGEIELVPRVGDHIVKFGSPGNYESKFSVLGTFYRNTMPSAGWDSYKEIDMRYKGQLVCRKK